MNAGATSMLRRTLRVNLIMRFITIRRLIASCMALALLVLTGCATSRNNYDPLEAVNRPVYAFNKGVDRVILHPVATAWTTVVPPPLQWGVHNFFENIADIFAIPAALLQGKGKDAGNSLGRVLINTTAGVGGLIDVASDFNFPKSQEDFGQVLGYWGVPSGPYLMLPFLGPVTTRDVIDPAVRVVAGPTSYISADSARYAYVGVNAVDGRAQLLSLDKTLAEQYDEYAFVRDAYLQRRWFRVYDGDPPHPLPMAGDDEAAAVQQPATSQSAQDHSSPPLDAIAERKP